ncbi:hypothetical protein LZ31DRAFT_556201 [Colletotrichum somersetense]|nr:hypothetical protein LZ31DRAFT_556201 [Colletotrichum somersetense]
MAKARGKAITAAPSRPLPPKNRRGGGSMKKKKKRKKMKEKKKKKKERWRRRYGDEWKHQRRPANAARDQNRSEGAANRT